VYDYLEIILIAAVSQNDVIGNKGKIPWYSKEELNHFKDTTYGYPIIMGRKTFESLNQILSNRINIVLTKNKIFNHQGTIGFNSFPDALKFCSNLNYEKVFIIGGGEVYKEAIEIADKLIISKMNFESDGDVFFPQIKNELWKEISIKRYKDFVVHYYIRK